VRDVIEKRARFVVVAISAQRDAPRRTAMGDALFDVDGERSRSDGRDRAREVVVLSTARAALDARVG